MLALIGTVNLSSCATERWELLMSDSASHSPAISALAFTDAKHGWAVNPWQLLETTDAGQTWTERLAAEGAEKAFYSLTFTNPATGFIVGSQRKGDVYTALILRTTDGGKTWQESPVNVAPVQDIHVPHGLHSISFCGPRFGRAAGSDLILHTTDGGQTWETQRSGNNEEVLFGVACVSPERAWAVGIDGLILQTADGGKSWHRQSSGTTDALVRVRFFGDSGWIVGGLAGKGTLLRTRDGGATWERVPLSTSEGLADISMNGQRGWIVGMNGTILHTNNGGQTWQYEKSPTNKSLTSIFFLNQQQGWIGGDQRTILKLVD